MRMYIGIWEKKRADMIYLYNNISIFIYAFLIKHTYCKNKQKKFLFICFLQMSLIIGLRQNVGADYESYYKIYNYLNNIFSYKYTYYPVEKGYEIINILCGKLGIPYWGVNMIVAILTNIFIVLAIRQFNVNALLAIYLYISFFFFYHSMNQTRQGLSMAIGLYAIAHLSKGRNIRFVSFVIFASLFHLSALLYLVLLVLRKVPISKKIFFLYIIGVIAILLGYNFIVSVLVYTKYGLYFGTFYDKQASVSTIINLIIRIIILVFVLLYFSKIKDSTEKNILYHMSFLCTFFQILTVASSTFGRITSLFFLGYIILIPRIVYSIKKNGKLLFQCYCGATLYQIIYYANMKASVLVNDYKFIFNNLTN